MLKTHFPINQLHTKILDLFRLKEPHHFSLLIKEYVNLLNQLASVSQDFSNGTIIENQTVKVQAFMVEEKLIISPDCELVSNIFEIKSVCECTLLQINITKVIPATLICPKTYEMLSDVLYRSFLLLLNISSSSII